MKAKALLPLCVMCAHLMHARRVELCILSNLWEDTKRGCILLYVLGRIIYTIDIHTYIYMYKDCALGELGWMCGKIVEFFDMINIVSLHQRQERTHTHSMWVFFFCDHSLYAVWSFKMCQTRVSVFWSKLSDIDGMNYCWWNLWNFCEYLLMSFTLRALWNSQCIDSLGGFITLVLSKTNKIASLNCTIVDPSYLPTYLPTYLLIWLKATTTLILIFCTNVKKSKKYFFSSNNKIL